MLRGLDSALMSRVRAYAQVRGLTPRDAGIALVIRGLDDYDARAAGARARNAALTATERSASAKHAVTVRDQYRG